MYIIFQGESLQIPVSVTGDKGLISGLTVEIKRSYRGEVPAEDAPTVATMSITDYTNDDITSGYLFTLADSSALAVGLYYINYSYTVGGMVEKGIPVKLSVQESVI